MSGGGEANFPEGGAAKTANGGADLGRMMRDARVILARRRFASALHRRTQAQQPSGSLGSNLFSLVLGSSSSLASFVTMPLPARECGPGLDWLFIHPSSFRPSVLPSLSLLIFRHQEMQLTPSSSMGNCVQPNPHSLFSFFSYLISALLISLISY